MSHTRLRGGIVLLCFFMVLVVQGCAHQKKCQVELACADKSMPNNGKCNDGSEAVAALACLTKPNTPSNCCYSWQQTGICDPSHPAARCTSVSKNGSCECKCQ